MKNNTIDTRQTGFNIFSLRENLGLSRSKLAELLNVSVVMVYKWESGEKMPGVSTFLMMSYLFKTPLDQIIIADKIKMQDYYTRVKEFEAEINEPEEDFELE